jgi:hypothetical protein
MSDRRFIRVLACSAAMAAATSSFAQVCSDFDPPSMGAWGCCGGPVFASDGISYTTEPFVFAGGGGTGGGMATIVGSCNGAPGHSLWLSNIRVAPDISDYFSSPGVRRVKFFYDDFGGSVNLRVNGVLASAFDDFADIPGAFFAGVGANLTVVAVWTGVSWRGTVTIEALPGDCLADVAIGGQELCIDDVCAESPCGPCPEDVDGDGVVGFADLLAVLAAPWGPCGGCPEDVTGDGAVGFPDLLAILAGWGAC